MKKIFFFFLQNSFCFYHLLPYFHRKLKLLAEKYYLKQKQQEKISVKQFFVLKARAASIRKESRRFDFDLHNKMLLLKCFVVEIVFEMRQKISEKTEKFEKNIIFISKSEIFPPFLPQIICVFARRGLKCMLSFNIAAA